MIMPESAGSSSSSPSPAQPSAASPPPPPLPPPGYWEVNGPALGFVAAALPLGALALFAADAANAVMWGALIGFGLALLDTAGTGWFLRSAAERMESPKHAAHSGEIKVLTVSFLFRVVVIALGVVAIQQRLEGSVDEVGFVGAYLMLHFVAVGGWGLYLQKRMRKQLAQRQSASEGGDVASP